MLAAITGILSQLTDLVHELGGLASAFGGVFSQDSGLGTSLILGTLMAPVANISNNSGGVGPLLLDLGALLSAL